MMEAETKTIDSTFISEVFLTYIYLKCAAVLGTPLTRPVHGLMKTKYNTPITTKRVSIDSLN